MQTLERERFFYINLIRSKCTDSYYIKHKFSHRNDVQSYCEKFTKRLFLALIPGSEVTGSPLTHDFFYWCIMYL